jgi:hypothetical protein
MFTLRQVSLSTGFDTVSANSVEFTRLAAEFFSPYAHPMLTNGDFGIAVRIVLLGVCRDRAAELAIYVEAGRLRGIIKESDVSFRCVLRCRKGAEQQPQREY